MLVRMKRDRRDRFDALCGIEYPRLVRTAYLITGDLEEARDLAQEALVRCYSRWGSLSEDRNVGKWLHRVVTNLALSSLRRERLRRRFRLTRDEEEASAGEFTDPALVGALHALPPAQRGVVVLRYCLDWSTEDVARALGKRPGTVRALASQGIARLRADFKELEEEVLADEHR